MSRTYDELKERILDEYDPDLLCEVLELTSADILDRFEDRVMMHIEHFEELS